MQRAARTHEAALTLGRVCPVIRHTFARERGGVGCSAHACARSICASCTARDPSAAEGDEIMTVERDPALDDEETVRMPRPQVTEQDDDSEEIDPEKTIVRENWESVVIRRVAPHVAAVQSEMAEDSAAESRYGWESEGLRRLAEGVRRAGSD